MNEPVPVVHNENYVLIQLTRDQARRLAALTGRVRSADGLANVYLALHSTMGDRSYDAVKDGGSDEWPVLTIKPKGSA